MNIDQALEHCANKGSITISAGGPGSGRHPGGGSGTRFMTPKEYQNEQKPVNDSKAKSHEKAAAFYTKQAGKTTGALSKLHTRAADRASKAAAAYRKGDEARGENHSFALESIEDSIQDKGGKTY